MKDVFEMGDKAVLKEGVDLDEMLKIMFPSEDSKELDFMKELAMRDKAMTSVAEHEPLLVEEVCDTGFFLKYEGEDDDEQLPYYYPKMFFEVAEDD